jgi:hypothetical protein
MTDCSGFEQFETPHRITMVSVHPATEQRHGKAPGSGERINFCNALQQIPHLARERAANGFR